MKAPFLLAFLAFAVTAFAQPNLTPGAPQTERILVLGGTPTSAPVKSSRTPPSVCRRLH